MQINFTKIRHFSGHQGSIYTMAADVERKLAYTAGGDGFVVRWDLEGDGDGELIAKSDDPVYSMFFWKEEGRLLLGTSVGELLMIDLNERKIDMRLSLYQGSVF